MTKGGILLLALLSLGLNNASAAVAMPVTPFVQLKTLLAQKDYLGARVLLRKTYQKNVSYEDWFPIRGLVNTHIDHIGFDMMGFWNAKHGQRSSVDAAIDQADALALSGMFEKAIAEYTKILSYLKKTKTYYAGFKGEASQLRVEDLRLLYPYVLHSLARAYYGAKHYDDALTVYQWIPSSYPKFRQVLFEKMWAAFRSGRVELALGAVASQRSAYMSRFLSPEAYLIEAYIYRKLCRLADLKEVEKELRTYFQAVEKGQVKDWALSEQETLVLQHLVDSPQKREASLGVTFEEREGERRKIAQALSQAFHARRATLAKDIRGVIAYASLARVSDAGVVLKPIQQLKGRAELAKRDLEVWPADEAEDWVDEVGGHYFLGDSLCQSALGK